MRGFLRVLLCTAVLPGVSGTPLHAKPSFVTFSLADKTTPVSINNNGAVTGYAEDQEFGYRGFVRQPDGTVMYFDVPGSLPYGVTPSSINDSGMVTGSYAASGKGGGGFLRKPDGTIKLLKIPRDKGGDVPLVITASGNIYGYYEHRHRTEWSFMLTPDGASSVLSCPTAAFVLSAANDSGQTVGLDDRGLGTLRGADGSCTYLAAGYPYAINAEGSIAGAAVAGGQAVIDYLRTPDGTVTNFQIKNANANAVFPVGINASRVIAGHFADKVTGAGHGYVRDATGHITVFDVPGATVTVPTGINDSGAIVGYWTGTPPDFNPIGFIRYP